MDWNYVIQGLIDTAIFSIAGIILMGIGFLIVRAVAPFSIKKEIEDDQNVSLAIIIGSVIIGISIIIASVITSPSGASKRIDSVQTETKTGK